MDNRSNDKLILQKLESIEKTLRGETGICVRVGQLETKAVSIQTELREHKDHHKDWISLLIALVAVLIALLKRIN